MLHEGREGVGPLRLAVPRPGVLPLLCDGAVQALDLSVLPGAERPRIYVPAAGRLQQLVELAAAVARAVVPVITRSTASPSPAKKRSAAHERRAGALALVGLQLRVGDPAVVVDRDVQAGAAGAAGRAAAPPQRAVPAAIRYPRHLLDVHVDELAGPAALVAHGGDGAAPPDLAGHAVDVGEPGHPAPRHDPGAGADGHAGGGCQPGRGEQQRRARLADLFVASKMLTKQHVAFEYFDRHVLHCILALPSIKAASMRRLAPLNSTSLPWWIILSIMADASLSSPRTVPHFENSMFVVNIMLRLS